MPDTRVLTVERSTSTAHRLNHYEGVCGNVHGHNMVFEVEATIDMGASGREAMPVDLKDVSELIDEIDHAVLINKWDPLLDAIAEYNPEDYSGITEEDVDFSRGHDSDSIVVEEAEDPILGKAFIFNYDPTCEVVSQWMADRIVRQLDDVLSAEVTIHETEKYGIEATAEGPTRKNVHPGDH